jgi:hypothetical protein
MFHVSVILYTVSGVYVNRFMCTILCSVLGYHTMTVSGVYVHMYMLLQTAATKNSLMPVLLYVE